MIDVTSVLQRCAAALLFASMACFSCASADDELDAVHMTCTVSLPPATSRQADFSGTWRFDFNQLGADALRCESVDGNPASRPDPESVFQYWFIFDDVSAPDGTDFSVCIAATAEIFPGRSGSDWCGGTIVDGAKFVSAPSYLGPAVSREASGGFPDMLVALAGPDAQGVSFVVSRLIRARTSLELQGDKATVPLAETSGYVPIAEMRRVSITGPYFARLAETTVQIYWPPQGGPVSGNLQKLGKTACTGTLVGPRHILTNEHCFENEHCWNAYVRFDHFDPDRYDGPAQPRCHRILRRGDISKMHDYLLFELDSAPPPVRHQDPETGEVSETPRVPFDLEQNYATLAETATDNVLMAHHARGDAMFGSVCLMRPSETEDLIDAISGEFSEDMRKPIVAHGCGTQPGSSGALMAALTTSPTFNLKAIALHVGSYELFGVTARRLREDFDLPAANFAISLETIRREIIDCIENNICPVAE